MTSHEVTQKVKSTDNPTDHELFKKCSIGLERALASRRAATRRARSAATSSHPPETPAKGRSRVRGKSRLGKGKARVMVTIRSKVASREAGER